ncbi:MAG: nicotinate phosphoribosyltransferase [Chlamydiales bacterium]|nr:nicotinate phosphoribosyltransferase [Chlamydiales bacterium]
MPSSLSIYKGSLSLLTDLYQLTMAYGYWKSKTHEKEAVFHLFFRRCPFKGEFAIASGLEAVADFINSFAFDASDIEYLSSLKGEDGTKPLFDSEFLLWLSHLHFSVDIDAVPEGSIVFPYEPILRVQGTLLECQLLETILLNLINFPTLIATKAARICMQAQGDAVLEFGVRRAQGIDGALTATRSAFIGGCTSTSHVLAGKLFGIPVKGTHAHSWIMSFDDELSSFYAYAEAMPDNCVFLVDTYDTENGIRNAIKAALWLREKGKKLVGVRLDSGELASLSMLARKLLDEAGFLDAKIFASNELDEFRIEKLKKEGSKISVWGVGTHLVTGKGQSALDGVYKMSAVRWPGKPWQYKMKLSEQLQKISIPGILQVKRYQKEGVMDHDVIYSILNVVPEDGEDLLIPIFRKGVLVYKFPSLIEVQAKVRVELSRLPKEVLKLEEARSFPVKFEKNLEQLKESFTSHAK